MDGKDDWERLIEGLQGGDEAVVAEFCGRYGPALERVAAGRIAPGQRRRVGPETVVESACCSFLMRARDGRFALPDADALWRLLCAITLRKLREKARFHGRERRALHREIAGDEAGSPAARAADPGPAPDEALAIAETFEQLIGSLELEERRIVELKLEERSNAEVAAALGCSERTVRRLTSQLRERLEAALRVA
jgi:RNA polymerase sigma factor (sigma-70 family)